MAHVLNIIYSATTITLASGSSSLRGYVPRLPATLDDEALTLTETVQIEINGATLADVQTTVQGINRAFAFARQKIKTGSGYRVFAEFTPDGYADAYRSELIDGRIDYDEGALDSQWVEKKVDAVITWTRRYFWEGPLTALTLVNGSGSGTSITVYNHDDATANHDNWVQLAAAAIAGDLPAPLYLYANNSTVSGALKDLYYACNYIGIPASFTPLLEAESASGGTTTVDATCSNGNRKDISWSATTETTLLTWTLTPSQLQYADNQFFQTLLRFSTAPAYTNLWLRWTLQWSGNTVWRGPLVKAGTTTLQELGVIQLPPGLLDSYSEQLTLVLSGLRNSAGTHTLALDFMHLMPMAAYRKLKAKSGASLVYAATLIDDQIEDDLYSLNGSLYHAPTHAGLGQLRVWPGSIPGVYQRIYFLHQDAAGGAGVDRTLSIQIKYRPRRVTL